MVLSRDEFDTLLRESATPCVSVYLPTYRQGDQTPQGRIRLKNLLHKAEEGLVGSGLSPPEAMRFLLPARRLVDDESLWQHQSDGLALFIAPELFHYYRLPRRFEDLVVMAGRFHILPLLPLLADDGRFLVLALSENEARLLDCTRYGVREMSVPDIPAGVEDALRYDVLHKERGAHEAARGGPGARMVTHGQGIGGEVQKERAERYLQAVDRALRGLLASEKIPLVLAGVDALRATYRRISSYPEVLEAGIGGSPDRMSAEQLHRRAWSLVEPMFARERTQAEAEYRRVVGTGLASAQLTEVLAAANAGRVSVLFVRDGSHMWAVSADDVGAASDDGIQKPGEQDLLDYAAVQTLQSGGRVHVLPPTDMPDRGPVAALFRY